MKRTTAINSARSGLALGLRSRAAEIISASGCRCWVSLLACALSWVPVASLQAAGPTYEQLKSFGSGGSGDFLFSGLVQGTDGALYGTAARGGTSGYGTVFKLNLDGSGFTVLLNFDYFTAGGYPYGGALVQGTDGALYGTASQGGSGEAGTVFKLNPDGTGFAVLQNFDYSTTGGYLYSGLMQGTDGALYGMASQGGSSDSGTLFKLNADGTGFTVLKNFDYSTTGGYPQGGWLIQGTDGALYGAAAEGGSSGFGTVFKLSPDGTGFNVLKNFDDSTTGGSLYSGLMQGTDGALYGTAYQGGSSGGGTVFKLNPDGAGFTVLQNFDYSTTGAYNYGSGLVQGTDGTIYGTARSGGSSDFGTVFQLNPDGTDFTVVLNFDYSTTGGFPSGSLKRGTDGNLYGTTSQGGDNGVGTVFRLVFASVNNPPVAKCKNVTVSVGAGCTAAASIDDGSLDPDAGDTIIVTQSPAGPYALGATPVTLTVTDNHGASASCTATVTVVDDTNPGITCPANQMVNATSPAGAVVTFATPMASDNCSVASLTCSPASGSTFAVGATVVTCTATDGSGNPASCSFTVTVKSAAEQVSDLLAVVQSMPIDAGLKNALSAKLQSIACGQLQAFINQVNAQAGKKLTPVQASQLIQAATQIRAALGC